MGEFEQLRILSDDDPGSERVSALQDSPVHLLHCLDRLIDSTNPPALLPLASRDVSLFASTRFARLADRLGGSVTRVQSTVGLSRDLSRCA